MGFKGYGKMPFDKRMKHQILSALKAIGVPYYIQFPAGVETNIEGEFTFKTKDKRKNPYVPMTTSYPSGYLDSLSKEVGDGMIHTISPPEGITARQLQASLTSMLKKMYGAGAYTTGLKKDNTLDVYVCPPPDEDDEGDDDE